MRERCIVCSLVVSVLVACGSRSDPAGSPPDDTDTDTDTDTVTDTDDADNDGSPDALDCDDLDPAVFPGAPDVCGDDRVTDCDRSTDDGLVTVDGGGSFTDLQAALDAAAGGARVLVCPGRYEGGFVASSVELVSHGGPDVTTIDGGARTTLEIGAGSSVTGFTIQGGRSDRSGGGIVQTSSGALVVTDCVITGNAGAEGGGVHLAENSAVVIASTRIHDNVARTGGGLHVPAGTTVDLTGTTLDANSADTGAGVHVSGGAVVGGLVLENEAILVYPVARYADNGGGGVAVFDGGSLTGTEVRGNRASLFGAGLFVVGGEVVLTDVTVTDNSLQAGSGGGIAVLGGSLTMAGTTEVRNNVASQGGGLFASDGAIAGGRVVENLADSGGGLYLVGGSTDGVTVEANAADLGGGAWLERTVTISGGRFTGNDATGRGGGLALGVHVAAPVAPGAVDEQTRVTVVGTSIVDNTARNGGGVSMDTSTLTLEAAEVLRNTASEGGGGVEILGESVFGSIESDWGLGADDNAPGDVFVGLEVGGYGTDATFDCDASACSPLP